MVTHFPYNTAFGKVTIESDGTALTRLAFGEAVLGGSRAPTALTNTAANQLQEYLAGKRRLFDVPVSLAGTRFQRAVWQALELVPYGQTRTYSQLAEAIGHVGAARAVGNACNRNPLPLFVPCHRIVPAGGGVGGYAGGPRVKRFLLELEACGL